MGDKGARLTEASESFQDDVVARLGSIGRITSRKMFGGSGIFHDGAMFGIISKKALFFKADENTLDAYKKARSKQHKPMPYYAVPSAVMSKKATKKKRPRDVTSPPLGERSTRGARRVRGQERASRRNQKKGLGTFFHRDVEKRYLTPFSFTTGNVPFVICFATTGARSSL